MTRSQPDREGGQILPLFALFVVVLLGFAALAVDVSGVYAAKRFYKSTADAAALAGAQNLQQTGSRTVAATERIRARQDAMNSVTSELGITGTLPVGCATAADADVTDASCLLPGTAYHVSIRAGTYAGQPVAIACQSCDPARSVQVGLRNGTYPLSFAGVLGQSTWNVGVNSVAGLAFGKSFAIQTLKPPEAGGGGGLPTVRDIELAGGSVVTVQTGDVGTNANMVYSGGGSQLNLTSGYGMYWYDPVNPPFWSGPPSPPAQIVQKLPQLMPDPNYTYPAMSGSRGLAAAHTFGDGSPSSCKGPSGAGSNPACTNAQDDPATCGAEWTYLLSSSYVVPAVAGVTIPATQPLNQIYCYNPGIYNITANPNQLSVPGGGVAILMPGAYYFTGSKGGLDISGWLLGGYRPGAAGVAVMLDECGNGCNFQSNSSPGILLNAGSKFPVSAASGTPATAAIDWDNQLVQTSGPSSPTPPLLMTLLVKRDPACTVPTSPPFFETSPCQSNDNQDKTLNLNGNGSLILEGVQYMPSDRSQIGGSSSSTGRIGQVISWTLKYAGGIQINQQGPGTQKPGTLRLDVACSGPGTPCNP